MHVYIFFFNIIIFWAIFLRRYSTDRKEVHCAKISAKQVKQCTSQKVLLKAWDRKLLHLLCCAVNNIYLIPRQIYVKTFSSAQTHSIIIRFFEWWPEFLMFIAMPGKIQDTERYKNQKQLDKKILKLTLHPEHSGCTDWKHEIESSFPLSSLNGLELWNLVQ